MITTIWTGHEHEALSMDPAVAIAAYPDLTSHILGQAHRKSGLFASLMVIKSGWPLADRF